MNRTILPALLTSLLLTATAMAQLTGTYTIDSSMPTAGSNYTSFIDAANDLQTMGVSTAMAGDVTFVVSAGTSPYAGFSLGVVPGTSAANRVIFLGAPGGGPKPILSGPAAGFVQTVRFGTSTSVSTTSVGTGPTFVVFDNFEITGAPSGAAFLALGCDSITVRNCIAHTSGSGIGFSVTNNSVIEDCEVYGTNHVPGAGGSTSYSGGISVYYLSASNLVQRNRIHDCADNGIFVGSSGSTTATPNNIIINNFIWNCGTQTSATYAGGIACRRVTGSIVANNSISMPANSLFAGIFLMGGSSTAPLLPAEVSNNIVQHNGTGAGLQTEYTGQLPATTDYNLYDNVGGGPVCADGTSSSAPTTPYATLTAWQMASGVDAASIQGPAGFILPTDLHITPASLAFNTGWPVASVLVDIDGQARPLGGVPDIGADETPASGLFAGFSGTPTSGNVPLTVNFTDASYSSAGSVTSWAWDFDNDMVVDSTVQNPTWVYTCPGSYTVSLTVNDGVNPPATQTLGNYIQTGGFAFGLQTTGGGVGDLVISPIPTSCGQAMGATSGWTLVSLATVLPVGAGPAFGVVPDASFWTFLFWPEAPGSLPHFTVTPGLYPDAGPIFLPPGSVTGLAGQSLDGVMVFLGPANNIVHVSNVARATF